MVDSPVRGSGCHKCQAADIISDEHKRTCLHYGSTGLKRPSNEELPSLSIDTTVSRPSYSSSSKGLDTVKSPIDDSDDESQFLLDETLDWPLDRVLVWLATNGFSSDWQEAFKQVDIHGSTFLNLGRRTRYTPHRATMHQTILPTLIEISRASGTTLELSQLRDEGKRLRRLVKSILDDMGHPTRARLPDRRTSQNSGPSIPIVPTEDHIKSFLGLSQSVDADEESPGNHRQYGSQSPTTSNLRSLSTRQDVTIPSLNQLDYMSETSDSLKVYTEKILLPGVGTQRHNDFISPIDGIFHQSQHGEDLEAVALDDLRGVCTFQPSADGYGESIFSSAPGSLFSETTGVSASTASTQYSAAAIVSATHQFVDLLYEHEFLQPLIHEAIQSDAIGADRFSRNFRRLLKKYSTELKEEAGESLQYHAAKLIQWKARAVADLIKEKYVTRKDMEAKEQLDHLRAVSTWVTREISIDDVTSDEDDPTALQEEGLETLAPVKDFLLSSAAFENLMTNFEAFVRPRMRNQQQLAALEETVQTTSPQMGGIWTDRGFVAIRSLLVKLGVTERPHQPGKERVRWFCRCGKELYDDYVELRPGALKELCTRLGSFSAPRNVSSRNDQDRNPSPSASRNLFSAAMGGLANMFGAGRKGSSSPCIPLHNTTSVGTGASGVTSKKQQNILRLLFCMKNGKLDTSLYQEEICGLTNDRQLFKFLQDEYMRHRSRLYSLMSLRAPESLNLVKFNLIFGKSVDVRKHELDCIPNQSCNCLPPPDRVEPAPAAEYRCTPIPPGLCPPLGSGLLIHLFHHPECLEDDSQTWILEQFSKKLRGQLERRSDGPAPGWGIHFKEGWNWDRIGWVLGVYVLGSLVFGVAWTLGKNDVQGAFGVAAYLASTATVFLGYVATRHV